MHRISTQSLLALAGLKILSISLCQVYFYQIRCLNQGKVIL